MKNKILHQIIFTIMASLLLFAALPLTGCAGKTGSGKSLLGTVKQVIVGDDYYQAGKNVGGASVVAYGLLKGDSKYDKYTKKCEELYAALQTAEGGATAGGANEIALEVLQAALTAKYGYAKASLITTAVRIGGAVADRIIAKKVDEVAANQFLNGFRDGVEESLAGLPADALTPAEKTDDKPFECPDGNCTVNITNRKVSHQIAVAKELLDGGYADKEEVVEIGEVSKYDNISHFVERCKILQKYKVKKTVLYIKQFVIEGGKLKTIAFKMINDDGKEIDVDCVGCMDIPEIADLLDE